MPLSSLVSPPLPVGFLPEAGLTPGGGGPGDLIASSRAPSSRSSGHSSYRSPCSVVLFEFHHELLGQAEQAGAPGERRASLPGRGPPEARQDAQVLPLQEPRLRVPAEGPQALLQLEGLRVREVQPDRGETAGHGGAGNPTITPVSAASFTGRAGARGGGSQSVTQGKHLFNCGGESFKYMLMCFLICGDEFTCCFNHFNLCTNMLTEM